MEQNRRRRGRWRFRRALRSSLYKGAEDVSPFC